jgi:divalent metal cation (Fe/Co/Zn/Cd) transporter
MNRSVVQKLISVVVISSYLLKSTSKIIGGAVMSIPVLVADGIHGLFDIAEHGFLVLGGFFARKQNKEKYPLDRQPLIDLLGLGIYIGLVAFALIIITQSVKMFATAVVKLEWITATLPGWLEYESELAAFNPQFYLFAAVILLVSYGISEWVYRFEYRLADKHNIREMKADAIGLRSDGWLELATGLSLFFAWILIQTLSDVFDDSTLLEFSSLIMAIILFSIGMYLIFVASHQIVENFNNLMNVALDKEQRERLESQINKRLPEGCRVISPLVCYHRGDQLFIKGHLSILHSMMGSADFIIKKTEAITTTFFSDSNLEIYAQFSPFFEITRETIEEELNTLLQNTFQTDPHRPVSRAFLLLKMGRIQKAQSWIEKNEYAGKSEEILGRYILSECSLQMNGPQHEKTITSAAELQVSIENIQDPNYKGFILAWLLVYHAKAYSQSKEKQSVLIENREEIQDYTKIHPGLSSYIFAEIHFALGFSWERCIDYDLKQCRYHYEKAETYYIKSGIRSEIDRLYNTWGHFETLAYSLGDAENHLAMAENLREIKNDILGLTYTYGCLGDLYSRMGRFEKAEEYYKKDIHLLDYLGIAYQVDSVKIKMAEQILKAALLSNDLDRVKSAQHLSKEVLKTSSYPFFAQKGFVKATAGMAELALNEADRKSHLDTARTTFKKMKPNSSYEEAFYYRLEGRLAGLSGDAKQAVASLKISQAKFEHMKDPLHELSISIQATISELEAYKWSLIDGIQANGKPEVPGLYPLNKYIESLGGMIGSTKERIDVYLVNISNYKNPSQKIKDLTELIWFMEG